MALSVGLSSGSVCALQSRSMCAAQETSAAATAAVRTLTLERDGLLDQRDVLIRMSR